MLPRGSIEDFNPRSIARNFQSPRPRSIFFNPRALWGISGPKRVTIESTSGPKHVRGRGSEEVGVRSVGPAGRTL